MESGGQALCRVRLVPSNNYFIRLPGSLPNLSVTISDVPVVQLILSANKGISHYCTVLGRISEGSTDVVECGAKVGLADRQTVVVRRPPESVLGLAVKVVVAPETMGDWQILQLNQGKLERIIMEQVRVVQPGQRLRITMANIVLVLRVKSVQPEREAVILQSLTEFHVDVPENIMEQEQSIRDFQSTPAFDKKPDRSECSLKSADEERKGIVSNIFSSFFTGEKDTDEDIAEKNNFRNQFIGEPFKKIFRVQPDHHELQHPYICYIPSRLCPQTETGGFVANISFLPKPGSDSEKQAKASLPVFVKPFTEEEEAELNTIHLSQTLIKWKGISVASLVLVESLPFEEKYLNNIQLYVVEQRKEERFLYLRKKCKIKFRKEDKLPISLKVDSLELWYVSCKEELQSDLHQAKMTECSRYLRGFWLRTRHSNILVSGNSGTGKTSFIKQISNNLGKSQAKVASKYLNCVTLKGKKFEVVRKMLEGALEELSYLAPSLLLLDNVDSLVGREDPDRPDYNCRTLATWLRSALTSPGKYSEISVIATAVGPDSVHELLQSSQGSVTFRKQVSLKLPDREEIQRLVRLYSGEESLSLSTEFLALAEGFYPLDIRHLVEKAVTRHDDVSSDSLTELIKEFTPISKWGQNLRPPVRKTIDDVGSLEEAKAMLVQTLLWPSKYPGLFSSCGVRTPRGILLYGAPGTGKTLLAEAVSSYTGLNFIQVRGPELLSKYIGASEANVRDLFLRAQSARPCIIFFDEFESLAPRRGQDSTGVTDRVVNQLLTQLDGVEGLEGVWVIAASSRPDLIDPALLRPGRLDRLVLCPLPDRKARLEILRVLVRTTSLQEDVQLEEVAGMTNNLTGADLQGLVYTAQLSARDRGKGGGGGVSQDDFNRAVAQTQPSVSVSEARKYEKIYSRFQAGKQSTEVKEQKVTLA